MFCQYDGGAGRTGGSSSEMDGDIKTDIQSGWWLESRSRRWAIPGELEPKGMNVSKRLRVKKGSGNVFADIGIPNPEEALAKAEIARRINHMLADRKVSQVEAGKILGIPQPRVSDLARGRLGKFSLEKLIDFAKRLGNDVEIRIRPSRKPRLRVA